MLHGKSYAEKSISVRNQSGREVPWRALSRHRR
jgi:hypothetical protein